MNETELRELDAWIAEHVMGLKLWVETPLQFNCILSPNQFVLTIPNRIVRARIGDNPTKNFEPTKDDCAAALVFKKCVAKCPIGVEVSTNGTNWFVDRPDGDAFEACFAETLPLAICMFAKKLFS